MVKLTKYKKIEGIGHFTINQTENIEFDFKCSRCRKEFEQNEKAIFCTVENKVFCAKCFDNMDHPTFLSLLHDIEHQDILALIKLDKPQ